MKRLLLTLAAVTALAVPQQAAAQNKVQNYINTQMKVDPNLKNAVVGILAVDKDGKEIASWNPDMPLLTASTMKTITTGVAYKVLGPDYRFSTRIAYDGTIDADGTLNGNLFIVGGGDPTLASRDTIAYPIDSIFGIWASEVRKAGIKSINGSIIGDDRFFSNEVVPDDWSVGNLGYDYGSGTTGLNFCENLSYFELAPGKAEGQPAKVTPLGPDSPLMNYAYEVTTGEPKSGDQSAYYCTDMAPVGKFVGTYSIDRRVDTVACSNKFGPMTCAYEFYKFLEAEGVPAKGFTDSETYTDTYNLTARRDLNYICETFSPELRKIVKVTNTISNNFFAETILKTVGKVLIERETGLESVPSYWRATRAVKKYLETEGLDITGFTQSDGSGLSRENYVSPRFFCKFYKMMMDCPDFKEYFESFPGPGRPGTLKNVLKNADPKIKASIHAKSGSLSSVRCYAGFVETKNGLIRFAILTNNYACPTSTVQPKIEGFMNSLATYGASR